MIADRGVIRAVGVIGVLGGAALLYVGAGSDLVPWERFFGRWNTGLFLLACAALAGGAVIVGCSFTGKPAFTLLLAVLLGGTTWVLMEAAGLLGVVSYPVLFGLQEGAGLASDALPHADIRGETQQDTLPSWGVPLDPIPFHYTTNRYGLRSADDSAAADVYVIGDSLIVAGLVPIEHTLTAQLERRLAQPAMGVALNGIGVQEQHELFDSFELPVDRALILQAVFEGNDLLDSRRFRAPRSGRDPVGSSFTSNAIKALRRFTSPRDPRADFSTCHVDGQLVSFLWTGFSHEGLDAEIPEVLNALDGFRARVVAAGATYGVFFVPSKLRVLAESCDFPAHSPLPGSMSPLRDALVEWSEEQGMPLLDLTEPLRGSASTALPWFHGDSHWNAAGQAVAARAIVEWPLVRTWVERRNGLEREHVPEVVDRALESVVE